MIADELKYRIFEAFSFPPTTEQAVAISVFTDFLTCRDPRAVMILRGSAGTGKTTLAAAIVKARPLATTGQLVDVVRPLLKPSQEKKELSMVFQALRIEVNGELDALRKLLAQSVDVLNPGGRLAIITYHSLEDRLVKNFMRTGNVEGKQEKDFYGRVNTPWRVVTGKVIAPSDDEVARNPRSRSAKLRVAELVEQPARGNKHQ